MCVVFLLRRLRRPSTSTTVTKEADPVADKPMTIPDTSNDATDPMSTKGDPVADKPMTTPDTGNDAAATMSSKGDSVANKPTTTPNASNDAAATMTKEADPAADNSLTTPKGKDKLNVSPADNFKTPSSSSFKGSPGHRRNRFTLSGSDRTDNFKTPTSSPFMGSPGHRRNRLTLSGSDRPPLFPGPSPARAPPGYVRDTPSYGGAVSGYVRSPPRYGGAPLSQGNAPIGLQWANVQRSGGPRYDIDACEMGGTEHGIAVRDFAYTPPTNESAEPAKRE